MDLKHLEKSINYKFRNTELLKNALTHTSYAYENKNNFQNNERIEFLGDAVLELVISEYLFNTYKDFPEGEMTKIRASVVCEASLYQVAKKHSFGDFLFLGKSEEMTGGRERPSILSDGVEAVIGAIYLDGGIEDAREFIISNLKDSIVETTLGSGIKDYKTILQEKLQESGEVKIEYNLLQEIGPDHNKQFSVSVSVGGKELGRGRGKSKKEAEQHAAQVAIEEM